MGKVIAIANQKGGVGKSTTAVNLSASLALSGEEVLIIDSDPQGNSTSGLGLKEEGGMGLYDALSGRCGIRETIRKTAVEHLSLVASDINLLGVEIELAGKQGRERALLEVLKDIREAYRFIIIDCPPSLGILTLNALVAADSVLVPVQCEYYALEGIGMLSRTLKLVRGSFNPSLEIEGVLLTMYDMRNALSAQVAEEIRRHFGKKVYSTVIPRNVALAEAPSHGKPIILYDARSKGAQSYISLAKEILNENGFGQRT
jgi:chromosome partitioning protein